MRRLTLALLLAGCGGPPPPPETAPGCNPLIGDDCLSPFPSSFFEIADPATPTGVRVRLPEGLLKTRSGVPYPTARLGRLDGFSPATFFTVYFAAGLDPASLPAPDDAARTVKATSPVQLLDLATLERVPLLVELDANAVPDLGDRQALIVRPLVRLQPARRYVVALVGLRDRRGRPIAPAPFVALRDRTPRSRSLDGVAARSEELFAALERAGVPRPSLSLAWDLVTASEAATVGQLTRLVAAARVAAEQEQLGYTIGRVDEHPGDRHLLRTITGTFQVPRYVTKDGAGAKLSRGPDGEPRRNGTGSANFVIKIPRCAQGAKAPLPVLIFGHGIFGGAAGELDSGYQRALGNRLCMVQLATDWIGLAFDDAVEVARALVTDLGEIGVVTERLQQAHVNAQLLPRLFRRRLRADAALQVDGRPVSDGETMYYLGISNGGIQGGAFMALSTEVERGILHVAGGGWSLMMLRAGGFRQLKVALDILYQDPLDEQYLIALTQSEWDYTDPIGFAPHLLGTPLPGLAKKRILLHEAIGDTSVPNLATRLLARTIGLPGIDLVQSIHGLAEVAAPQDSAYLQFDTRPTPLPPPGNFPPPKDNQAHDAVRHLEAVQKQFERFLRPDGRVERVCAGPCVFP